MLEVEPTGHHAVSTVTVNESVAGAASEAFAGLLHHRQGGVDCGLAPSARYTFVELPSARAYCFDAIRVIPLS